MKFTGRLRDGAGCTSHIAAADMIDELEAALRTVRMSSLLHPAGQTYRTVVVALAKLEALAGE